MISRVVKLFLDSPLLALVLCAAVVVWGFRSFVDNPKDAIPDIADNQTIVFTEWMGRSPKDVDEQITYPLTVALQGVPGVREIRATSGFGWSIVYAVFQDDVEFYWARSRVLERLNTITGKLPEGVAPQLGPDATALGQIFWYTVENGWYSPEKPGLRFDQDGVLTDSSRTAFDTNDPVLQATLDMAEPYTCPVTGSELQFGKQTLDELRSVQDYDIKLALESVEGVSEVAGIGGYIRQYQIDVDPQALRAFNVSLEQLVLALRLSNVDVGAKVVEQSGMEVLVRGVGFLGGGMRSVGPRRMREQSAIRDIENIVVKATDGTPVFIRQLANVTTGPDFRRGALDKMGAEAVGGCVVMRYGENPLSVIQRVKDRIKEIEPGLPAGVRINAFYDRSRIINDTMDTLGNALWQELLITAIAVILFLLHFRSSLVIAVTLPLSVLFAFVCMQALGVGSNIMSLAGIAIAIGAMVDMGIVMTENIYQHLTTHRAEYTIVSDGVEKVDWTNRANRVRQAAVEVGGPILTAISTTVISFVPVFFLEGQSAKLFVPLAWTKTFCLVGAAIMALAVVPPLASALLRDRRLDRRWAALSGLLVALCTAWGWQLMFGVNSPAGHVGDALRGFSGLEAPMDALVAGAIAFLLTWLVARERMRSIEDNPTSRWIHVLYEPLLKWILRNKITFLTFPVLIVIAGLAIWQGWGIFVTPVVKVFNIFGMHPEAWPIRLIVNLLVGAVFGLWILPLVFDSLRLVRKERIERGGRSLLQYIFILSFSVFIVLVLNSARLPGNYSVAVAGIWGVQSPQADGYYPIGNWMNDRQGIGREFMPPLDEGDFLYMPSVLPAGSINTVMEVMRKQDIRFANIPEVDVVVGKLGRIDSPLDPAPVGMLETVISLKPREDWPAVDDPQYPNRKRKRTMAEIWSSIQEAGRYPGVLPSVELQPIRTRVEMLSTGLSARIGLKIYGDNQLVCERLATDVEKVLREKLRGATSINAIRSNGKPYLEFRIDREAVARYGVSIREVQSIIEVAIGGRNITTTYEGLDRYPVRIRYQRELRDELPDLERILVSTKAGAQIPIKQVADIVSVVGPMSVRREGARYVSYVTMTNVGIDETTLVDRGRTVLDRAVADGNLVLPDGYYFKWAGSYERNVKANKRLAVLIPLVLLINFILIYMEFKRLSLAFVVFLAIPVSFAGGFILLHYWPDIHNWLFLIGVMDRGFEGDGMYLTVAVWVGFIALFGIAVDDGIVMGAYLDHAFRQHKIRRYEDIEKRVVEAGLRRIRPCLMTTFTTLAALAVVLISTGRGSDVMVPMAIPVFGGMVAAIVAIFVVPTCYCGLKQLKWKWSLPDSDFMKE